MANVPCLDDSRDALHSGVRAFLRSKVPDSAGEVPRPVNGTGPQHISSTLEERRDLGVHLLELSMDWKRTLSPMVSHEMIQEALIMFYRVSARWLQN